MKFEIKTFTILQSKDKEIGNLKEINKIIDQLKQNIYIWYQHWKKQRMKIIN